MKVSLIFLLVALYGAVADDDYSASSEEQATTNQEASVSASASVSTASSSSDDATNWGSQVQAVIDNMSDLAHGAVVDGSAKINSALDSALNKGVEISEQAAQLHKDIVSNVNSAAQSFTGKGIEHLTKLQANLESSPFGAILSPALAMKINGLKLGQKMIGSAAALETAKGRLIADAAASGAKVAKGVAGASFNIATTGSEFGNGIAKQTSSILGNKINSLSKAASGFSGSFLSGSGLSGDASSSSSSSSLSGRLSGSLFG